MEFQMEVVILLVAMVSMMTFMLVAVMYLKRNRESRYDFENSKIQLDKMRMYYEQELYNINKKLAANETRWIDTNHLIFNGNTESLSSNLKASNTVYSNFLAKHGLDKKDMVVSPKKVFVLTSFLESEIKTYHQVEKICNDIGLDCSKSDDEYIQGEILPHILKLIAEARIIIANIDGRNPNVYYELGIAHALDKPTILISKSINDVPFDLQSKNVLLYRDYNELNSKLRKELTRTIINN